MIIGETPLPSGALGVDAVAMTMRFGDFVALDNVELKVRPGSFHALLGENGAGKSTLVKCIMGYYHPTEGDVLVGGREQAIANPKDAHALGLGMVYQHFTLVPAMTVAENLVLARDDVPAVVNWSKEKQELEAFLARMPFKVPLNARVSDISAGERQKCEILKQLYLKRRFLILDEPTSVLTPGEADEVLGMLRDMVVNGGLTILMITHKFREVMAFADEVTILRRGKLAGSGKVADLTPDSMAAHDDRRRGTDGATGARRQVGAARLELDKLERARRCRRGRRFMTFRSPFAAAKSSASPASPATASGSSSRCWPASARPRAAKSACSATSITPAARKCAVTRCRCCPRNR